MDRPVALVDIAARRAPAGGTIARGSSMADRFDKFTERARGVLPLTQEESQRFRHTCIGTEHLLLGLLREEEGVAATVLANLGLELDKVRSAVEFIIARGDRVVPGESGLTPRAKKVIELAVDEARRLDHRYVGTEYLLLGLVAEGEGVAAGVLERLGVSLDRVRAQVVHVLSQPVGGVPVAGPQRAEGAGGYTAGARRAFALAQAEAGRLEHSFLGTGHLLIGLVADETGAAAEALAALGVTAAGARAELARATWPADEAETAVGPTARLRGALAAAGAEARRRGAPAVDSGHLLLGLLVERGGVGDRVLWRLGVAPDAARGAVEARLQPRS
jgi:ATP-dependent Clp protease ATP-binding subunit ClpA